MDKLMSSALLDKIMKVMGNNSVLMSFIKLRWLQHAHHRQEVALVVSGKLHEEHSSRWYCNSGILLSIYEYCHDYFPSLLKVIDKTRDDKSGGGRIIILTASCHGGPSQVNAGKLLCVVAVAGPPRVNHSEIITLYLPLSHPRKKKGDTSSSQQPKTSRSFFSSSSAFMVWTRHGNLWNFQCQYS